MLKQIRKSLITRLMAYFLVIGLILIILFGINFAHGIKVHFKQEILPNIAQYLDYIVQDIGTPPDLVKAKQLSQGLSFELSIQGPDMSWNSHSRIEQMSMLEFETAPAPYERYQIANRRGHNFVRFDVGDYQYTYAIGRPFEGKRQKRSFGFFVIIIVSMVVLFLLIRSSLKPLKVIRVGVEKIGQGDLDNPIEVHKSTEFINLANGINDMSQQIKSMLEGKQQLLLAISHELRSPITRAKVNLELLPDHPMKQALIDDCNEMEALVGLVLESERLNQRHAVLNKTGFALDELAQDVIEQYFSQAGIIHQLKPSPIHADQIRLSLLIKNLLDNALKYSSEDDAKPQIRVHTDNAQVVIEVEDYGCGMAQEELEHITQAFYRVDQARLRSTGGYGLGLYLCQLIVQAHQGTMTFSSQLDQGTRVTVVIPA